MGLKGIHDPKALKQFTGFTYCLWYGKDGQNKGTIVNHLRTVHYKLGLVCDLCFRHSLPTRACQLYQLGCYHLIP